MSALRLNSKSLVFPMRACALGIVFSLVTLVGCTSKQAVEKPAVDADPDVITVSPEIAAGLKLGQPQMTKVHGTLDVSAHVETDASRIARIGSPVSGRILQLLVFEGQTVHAGTVLATLHSTDLSATQFALVKATSEQGLAEAATRRAEQLVASDVIGRAELERRRAELLQATTEAASYRTQLHGLGMSDAQIHKLETTRKLNADYPIVAPRAGTILERKVTIGQVVQPADPAFTIADLSSVWITADVPEDEAGPLTRGMAVLVRIPALPDVQILGHLSYVAPIVNPATRTVQVHMDVANPHGLYKPDELASMTFEGKEQTKLTVPQTAIVREDNRDHVFIQTGANTFVLRDVVLGAESDDRRVLISGVPQHAQIVLDGAFHLNNQRQQNIIKGTR